jgi:hypothetical protein
MVISRPVVAEAQVPDVEGDELGAPAAAGEPEAEQGTVPDVSAVVLAHGPDEGAQGVDEHWVLLVRRDPSVRRMPWSTSPTSGAFRGEVKPWSLWA